MVKTKHDNNLSPVTLEGSRIIFRNFAGKEGQYNREGDRNFAVLLNDEVAQDLANLGWNVKYLKPREEDDEPQAYLQVSVNFGGRPPRVVLVSQKGRTPLDEDMVSVLDWADIKFCDMILRPYEWNVNGKSGVKAYLQSLFANIEEDELEMKYSDVPPAEETREED